MRNFTILFAVLLSMQVFSQRLKPIDVEGKIIVEGGDLLGISIFNKSTNEAAVTNEKGEFLLSVNLNDSIEVSALQFENMNFQINESILSSRNMKIFLIEEINKLDEIFIQGNGLSKNLETQIERTEAFNPKLNNMYFGIANDQVITETDYKTAVSNNTMATQRQRMIHGLNLVNVVDQLLLPLFRSEIKDKEETGVPQVPIESVKYFYGSEFLIDNFNIPQHRVEEFIRFVESENFDVSLLNYGKEMELLEVIYNKSLEFQNKN